MRSFLIIGSVLAGLTTAISCAGAPPGPRNVILFLGDGMGVATVTAARIYAGQLAGGSGEDHQLSFEAFRHLALVKTYNIDRQVPDSAGTMSAIVTGQPGRYGVLSIASAVSRGDCAGASGREIPTLLEQAEQRGFRTGIVTTTRVTHATPAALYAHSPDRAWESDGLLPGAATAAGCRDIARQLAEFSHGDGIDLVLAGGRQSFIPLSESDPEYPGQRGRRLDGRNLIAEWLSAGPGRQFVWNATQLESVPASATAPVLGLFEPDHMHYELDRQSSAGGEPDIVEMTDYAIRKLKNPEQGFFLMVEGGRIDHAHHNNNAARALMETVMLERAVARALELTDPNNTLIVVTADHGHTLSISGYPSRGNPILGTVNPVENGLVPEPLRRPYTTLGYINGPGYQALIPDLSAVDTTDPGHRQFAGWPRPSEAHSGEDVVAYAHGQGAERLHGVIEQKLLYGVLAAALFGE